MHRILGFYALLLWGINTHAALYKVSDTGEVFQRGEQTFACVLDDQTQLLWEVKTTKPGLQNTRNTYTWFDGKTGVENGDFSHHCHWGESCNTQAYLQALNQQNLCEKDNWRLPTEQELKTLLVYGDNDLLIDQVFFPNTQLKSYWSASEIDTQVAIDVPFFYGGVKSSDKSFDAHIRAVSTLSR